jgi:hypothetical protein
MHQKLKRIMIYTTVQPKALFANDAEISPA